MKAVTLSIPGNRGYSQGKRLLFAHGKMSELSGHILLQIVINRVRHAKSPMALFSMFIYIMHGTLAIPEYLGVAEDLCQM